MNRAEKFSPAMSCATASSASPGLYFSGLHFQSALSSALIGGTAAAFYLTLYRPGALAVAGPILSLWLASPVIAWWISRPLARRETRLTAEQTLFLRKLARKTWAFFETFVGPEDHWLPPDNYQEHPAAAVAHRTSPTNMGLALLSNLSAYDFGYLSAGKLIERTVNTLTTMAARLLVLPRTASPPFLSVHIAVSKRPGPAN